MRNGNTTHLVLAAIAALACLARFVALDTAPPGFFYDEATGAAHSMCYQQTGYDLFGKRGLFSTVDAASIQSTPFLAGSAVWTAVFGTEVAGFRSFIAFVSVLTILGIGVLAQRLTQDRTFAWWALALAACLPWSFQFSRISWDAPLGVMLLVWALVFSYARTRSERPDAAQWLCWLSAGALFALASYTYPPLRLQILALVLFLPALALPARAAILGLFALCNIPVVLAYLDPDFAARAQILALTSNHPRNPFADAGFLELLWVYVTQMSQHLSLSFLLGPGDANLRHSIQTHGVLDWLSFGGLLIGTALVVTTLRNPGEASIATRRLHLLCLLGIVTGLSPAALTWEGIPHALRSLGAWPFFVLLAAEGLHKSLTSRSVQLAASAIMVVLFGVYLSSFFQHYPALARPWFDADVLQMYRSTGQLPPDHGPVVSAYYLMKVDGLSCIEVRQTLELGS